MAVAGTPFAGTPLQWNRALLVFERTGMRAFGRRWERWEKEEEGKEGSG